MASRLGSISMGQQETFRTVLSTVERFHPRVQTLRSGNVSKGSTGNGWVGNKILLQLEFCIYFWGNAFCSESIKQIGLINWPKKWEKKLACDLLRPNLSFVFIFFWKFILFWINQKDWPDKSTKECKYTYRSVLSKSFLKLNSKQAWENKTIDN